MVLGGTTGHADVAQAEPFVLVAKRLVSWRSLMESRMRYLRIGISAVPRAVFEGFTVYASHLVDDDLFAGRAVPLERQKTLCDSTRRPLVVLAVMVSVNGPIFSRGGRDLQIIVLALLAAVRYVLAE